MGNGGDHIADLLTCGDCVALLDQGLTRRTNMLLHGNYQNIRFRELLHRFVAGVSLILLGVNTAKEQVFHSFTS